MTKLWHSALKLKSGPWFYIFYSTVNCRPTSKICCEKGFQRKNMIKIIYCSQILDITHNLHIVQFSSVLFDAKHFSLSQIPFDQKYIPTCGGIHSAMQNLTKFCHNITANAITNTRNKCFRFLASFYGAIFLTAPGLSLYLLFNQRKPVKYLNKKTYWHLRSMGPRCYKNCQSFLAPSSQHKIPFHF